MMVLRQAIAARASGSDCPGADRGGVAAGFSSDLHRLMMQNSRKSLIHMSSFDFLDQNISWANSRSLSLVGSPQVS